MHRIKWSLGVFVLCLMGVGTSGAITLPVVKSWPTAIQVVPISAGMINTGEVDTTVIKHSSSGLSVVGVGEPVYLQGAQGSLTATAYAWSMTNPSGSTAALSDASGMSTMFTPDMAGDYLVTLKLTHSAGDTTLTKTITAGTYVGVDKCGQCHPGKKSEWSHTGHATMLERGLSGTLSGHYGSGCVQCHSVGNNTSSKAFTAPKNGGFWGVADSLGWTFPSTLLQGSWSQIPAGQGSSSVDSLAAGGAGGWNLQLTGSAWDSLPAGLKKMANIQCESCHGPGSQHVAGGFAGATGARKIGLDLHVGVCAQCHDDHNHHIYPVEWANSLHSDATQLTTHGHVTGSASCIPCHTGNGFLTLKADGQTPTVVAGMDWVDVTCSVCHDPHSKENDHQLRFEGNVTLHASVPGQTGLVDDTVNMGMGATCAQCHHLRSGADVPGSRIHHSHQSEMIEGIGGYHYPGQTYASGAHKNIQNVCVTCHMAAQTESSKQHILGSHSWQMTNEYKGATGSAILYNVAGCAPCHGNLQNFDVNGAQTETGEQLKVLADLLPKRKDSPTEVAWAYSATSSTSATRVMTDAEVNAAYDYLFVEADASEGAHNHTYAKKLLADAINSLQTSPATATAGDFNGDKKVDFTDLFLFVAQFGKTSASADWDSRYDLSGNGAVGFTDYLMLLDLFGKSTAAGRPALVADNGLNTRASLTLMGSNRPSIDQDHLAVSLRADNLTQMRGYGAVITYDTKTLEFVRAVRAENGLISNSATQPTLTVVNDGEGRVTVSDAIVGDQAVTGSGQLVDLVFRTLGPADNSSVQIDFAQLSDLAYGMNRPSGAVEQAQAPTAVYSLNQNYPNPFNPATTIRYSVADPGTVKIVVYNTLGQVVRTLVDNYKLSGDYSVQWDGRDSSGRGVASGVYIYRMNINGFEASQRMVMLQ